MIIKFNSYGRSQKLLSLPCIRVMIVNNGLSLSVRGWNMFGCHTLLLTFKVVAAAGLKM